MGHLASLRLEETWLINGAFYVPTFTKKTAGRFVVWFESQSIRSTGKLRDAATKWRQSWMQVVVASII